MLAREHSEDTATPWVGGAVLGIPAFLLYDSLTEGSLKSTRLSVLTQESAKPPTMWLLPSSLGKDWRGRLGAYGAPLRWSENALLRAIHNDPNARFETLRELDRALLPIADERTRAIWKRSFGTRYPYPSTGLPHTGRHMGFWIADTHGTENHFGSRLTGYRNGPDGADG